ncbi:MAG: NADH-quinone oxidoreductase subunit NuoN [Xanthomonadales bacterium]|uniref:NADH-quinone oxidoreductase subunit NuoN n=1 Tax=Dokdonella sp. TaxID=2291710 RepID=UPI002C9FA045|nr:NADH-quinone oxidoreductase subunit NuoN [Xanthomonadales bacterium]HQV71495.1 NADH-quinone oxidoreductase subunit NuoN [Dokdonella sp.]MBK7211484.1 NADH-quinone oxidoreductase subunit NuoN [Xanthomonadales bacterium]MBL0221349.1 NADH-quinone oxidoreductase subunit NuoN [Xanthomonadales bacterium]HQW76913.1 NADH-quinone oxidoreductase subunit NuoN [Dokdonella sp.]
MTIQFNPADLLVILPELVLLGATCAILLIDLFLKPSQRDITHWLSIVAIAVTSFLVWRGAPEVAQGVSAFNGMFKHDGISVVLKQFVLLTTGLSLFYARNYMRERSLLFGEFYLLILFATIGMMLLVSAGSLVIAYLGLELLALSSYALVALNRNSAISAEAAIKYFVLGALASGLLLYGMSMIYGATGTLDLAAISAQINQVEHRGWLAIGLVFIVSGVAFKLGAAPFHMWLPDVYHGAPTAITVFIGSAPKVAAFGLLYRLLEGGLGPMSEHWTPMLALLSVLSLAVGNLFAIAQSNLKRMLAYSTISHIGFMLLGFVGGSPAGYSAAMFYIISYTMTATVAFGIIALLARAGFECEEIDDFKGLNQRSPWYAAIMGISMFSLAGVPPLFGFFAKLLVLKSAIDAGFLWLAIVAIIFAIIGIYYYLRVVKVMYFDAAADDAAVPLPADLPLRWVISLNGLALVVLGLAWGPLFDWCNRAFGV